MCVHKYISACCVFSFPVHVLCHVGFDRVPLSYSLFGIFAPVFTLFCTCIYPVLHMYLPCFAHVFLLFCTCIFCFAHVFFLLLLLYLVFPVLCLYLSCFVPVYLFCFVLVCCRSCIASALCHTEKIVIIFVLL